MEDFETMQELDLNNWNSLNAWCRSRISGVWRLVEEVSDQTGDSAEHMRLNDQLRRFFKQEENGQQQKAANLTCTISGSLAALCKCLQLDDFEIFCLILAMLAEWDDSYEQLFAFLNQRWNETYLSRSWAIRLYLGSMDVDFRFLRYFLPEQKLSLFLFETSGGHQGFGCHERLKLRQPIIKYLCSSGVYLQTDYMEWQTDSGKNNGELSENLYRSINALLMRENQEQASYICLNGQDEGMMRRYAGEYAATAGKGMAYLDFGRLREEVSAEGYHDIALEVMLHDGILCIYNWEEDGRQEQGRKSFSLLLYQVSKLLRTVFILTTGEKPEWNLPGRGEEIWITIPLPDQREQMRIWEDAAKTYPVDQECLSRMVNRYSFSEKEIKEIVQRACRYACEQQEEVCSETILLKSCREQRKHNLRKWATPVTSDYEWDDLVLPCRQKETMQEIVNHFQYRRLVYQTWGMENTIQYGSGLSVLFAGPPGTGKTMAAQVLCKKIGLELFKIDIPSIVSKYIGETEQHIRDIFREGIQSQAVLFFDEADVLFSKRTEVKDSHDKYSNMEAAYLLQKMEEYPGIVILATNFPKNIDAAFKRRIKYVMEFEMSDAEQRLKIWKQSIPEKLPIDDEILFEWLAETFEFSGSNIKNIIENAAFFAASVQETVGMRHILHAIEKEYQKMGRSWNLDKINTEFIGALC